MGEQVSSSSQIGDCRSSSKLLPWYCVGCAVAVVDRAVHWYTTRSNRAVNWRCGVPGSATTLQRSAELGGVDEAGSVGVGVVGKAAGTVGGGRSTWPAVNRPRRSAVLAAAGTLVIEAPASGRIGVPRQWLWRPVFPQPHIRAAGDRRPGKCCRPPFLPSEMLQSWTSPGAGRTGTSYSSASEPVREDRRGLARTRSLVSSGELELEWVVAGGDEDARVVPSV